MKARKLAPEAIISRSRPTEWISEAEEGAAYRGAAGWAFFAGLAWLGISGAVSARFSWGLPGVLALEFIYVAGVSITILVLANSDADPDSDCERRRPHAASEELVRRLALVAALHDGETASHCERIGALAYELAIELDLSRDKCERLRRAAVLHDLGKIGVDRQILLKPGPLNEWERLEVRKHVDLGAALLEGAQDPILGCALVAIRTHHEHWDGCGYPRGLAGEDIPIEGRIVAVCDVFDALASDRPYHPAVSPEDALAVVCQSSGAQFDPDIVTAFQRCFPRCIDLYRGDAPAAA